MCEGRREKMRGLRENSSLILRPSTPLVLLCCSAHMRVRRGTASTITLHYEWYYCSSVRYDNPGMPHLQYRRFSCRSWVPGDGDDIITELARVTTLLKHIELQRCSNILLRKGEGQIPFFQGEPPFNRKPRVLVGF